LLEIAAEQGAEEILVGLGGSASTDGGAGLASALGYHLLDRIGRPIPAGGAGLSHLERIVPPERLAVTGKRVIAACDVRSPLLGPAGAAWVYAPQKGADPVTVDLLERGLARLAEIAERDLGDSAAAKLPGAGAAGGTGFGLMRFALAQLARGAEVVLDAVGFRARLQGCRLVISGEGRFDLQSLDGKVTGEVARLAHEAGVPCLVVAGSASPAATEALRVLGGQVITTGGSGVGGPARAALEVEHATAAALRRLRG
ncbi:MAG: glycerate kinase, partial [Candidatus Dormibacteria bacterium]